MTKFLAFFFLAIALVGTALAQSTLLTLGVGGGDKTVTFTFTGDLDTAPSGIAGWWGFEASKASDRGTAAIRVCQPGGSPCADIATDATTGQITAATVATAGMSTCNNTTNICGMGIVSGSIPGLYDKSGNGHNMFPAATINNFVVPPGCPFSSTLYCMTVTNGYTATSVPATVCPVNLLAVFEDTTNGSSGPIIFVIPDAGTGIELDDQSSSRADFYNSGFQLVSSIPTNAPYEYFGGSGSSGFFNINGSTTAATNVGTCGNSHVAAANISGSGFTGFIFKMAYWNGAGAALPVSQATAATMITNTRARLGF